MNRPLQILVRISPRMRVRLGRLYQMEFLQQVVKLGRHRPIPGVLTLIGFGPALRPPTVSTATATPCVV